MHLADDYQKMAWKQHSSITLPNIKNWQYFPKTRWITGRPFTSATLAVWCGIWCAVPYLLLIYCYEQL